METTNGLPVGPPNTPPALGRISLIGGEAHASYNDLLSRFAGALNASDIIEEAWVRDVVDLTWEVLRMRRLKASLLNACAREGIEKALISINAGDALSASRGWS